MRIRNLSYNKLTLKSNMYVTYSKNIPLLSLYSNRPFFSMNHIDLNSLKDQAGPQVTFALSPWKILQRWMLISITGDSATTPWAQDVNWTYIRR